jgi:arylsulfatase A-like enzyme
MYANVGFEQMELAEHGSKRYEDDYHRYLKAHDLVDKYDFFDNYKEFRHQAPLQYEKSFGAAESMLPEKHYSTTWIGEKALSSIRHWKDEENFLMVSFLKPHHPFDPPAPWSRMYDPDQLSVLPGWTEHCLPHDQDMHKGHRPHTDLTQNIIKRVMAYYYGAISQIDDYVGKITDLLKAKGIYDNTLIVYTSDHGEYLGFHHMLGKLNYMYDPLEKVPLIIKYPDQYGKGTRSDALINNIDLAPTLLKQASCPPGEFMPGIDFSRGQSKNKYVFAENGIGQRFMVRSKTHKLLLCKQESKSLFFDLAEDPFELNNLYPRPEYKTMIDEYKQALSSMMLLGASSTAHSDESVPTIEGENVPPENENWRQELAAWITQKMQS